MKKLFASLLLLIAINTTIFAGCGNILALDGIINTDRNYQGFYAGNGSNDTIRVFLSKGFHLCFPVEDCVSDNLYFKYLLQDVYVGKGNTTVQVTSENLSQWYHHSEFNSIEYGRLYAEISGIYSFVTEYHFINSFTIIAPALSGTCGENLTWAFDTVSGNLAIYGSGTMTSHPWENISPALIKSVTLPPALTSICDSAFYNCSALTSVTIPNSVTGIGEYAFHGCDALTSITCEATTPPTMGEYAFDWVSYSIPVYVPCGTVSAYNAAGGWSSFYNIQEPLAEYSIQVSASNGIMGTAQVDKNNGCGCNISATANYGYHFVQWSDGNTGNPRSLVLTQDTILTAEFAPNQYTIITTSSHPERGTTQGDATVNYLENVTISAIANYGYHFTHWNDKNKENPRLILAGGKEIIIAASTDQGNAGINDYNSATEYTVSKSGVTMTVSNGIIGSYNNIHHYRVYKSQTLTLTSTVGEINSVEFTCMANNDEKYGPGCFTWSTGDYSYSGAVGTWTGSANEVVFTASLNQVRVTQIVVKTGNYHENQTYTAYFDKNTYYITKNYNSNQGYINGSSSGEYLDNITLTAEPKYGYHFTQWSDGNTENPRYFELTQDTTFTAEFAPNSYAISTQSSNIESGTTFGDTTTTYLDYVTISATANYGYHFTQWSDGNTDNPRQVQVTEDKIYTASFSKNTYYITKKYDSAQGCVNGSSSGEYLDNITLTAEPNYGYHFTQWSDGNTDNPRHFILTQDTTFSAEFAQTFSGQCGDNLYWSYQNNTLTISGFGGMYDNRPWGLLINEIQHVVLPNGITHIGDDAFSDCTGLNEITIPYTVTAIGDYAFAGCRKLVHVNCYAINPPMAESTSFANYNVYLNVPCNNLQDYQLDMVFGSFKYIQCMEADSENVPTDTVIVTPGTNDVTITWPTDKNADTYSIEIKRGDVVFCTLTFDKNGMLTNIAFAPSRSGSHPVTYAASTGNGLRFTVTSLDAATTYGYNVTTKDEEDNTLSTYSGEFTTKSNVTTDMDNIQSPVTTCQKLLRNGQLIILRDGKEYNAMGQEIQ